MHVVESDPYHEPDSNGTPHLSVSVKNQTNPGADMKVVLYSQSQSQRKETASMAKLGGCLRPVALGGCLRPVALGGCLRPVKLGGCLRPVALGGCLRPQRLG